jgi:hypothetical protein
MGSWDPDLSDTVTCCEALHCVHINYGTDELRTVFFHYLQPGILASCKSSTDHLKCLHLTEAGQGTSPTLSMALVNLGHGTHLLHIFLLIHIVPSSSVLYFDVQDHSTLHADAGLHVSF